MDYSFFGHFLSYIQMMAAIDLALIFIDKGSLAVKLQNRILEFIREQAHPILNKAGTATQRCRKDRLSKTEKGKKALGLADIIRGYKTAFEPKTEAEKLSSFLPAMGLTSGIFCIIYMILIPYLLKSQNELCLHFLIFATEAIFISQAVTVLTLFMKETFLGYLSSLIIAILWIFVPMFIITILHLFNATIECFSIEFYLSLFILLPMTPILTMAVRICYLIYVRYSRIRYIKNKTKELQNLLELSKNGSSQESAID